MFIETHKANLDENIQLTFVKSSEIQAYPCGRRRSSFVNYDTDGDGTPGEYEGYRIPFDPEARLNTEANNRKQSSLNGFTQTYLVDWNTSNKTLSMVLGGYLFNIMLSDAYVTKTAGSFAFNAPVFGTKILEQVEDADATKIYANILIEDVSLFSSGFREYYTGILRDQLSDNKSPSTSIDTLATAVDPNDYDEARKPSNYYFAGLSFSTAPLTGNTDEVRSSLSLIVERENMPEDQDGDGKKDTRQLVVSLCILERADADSDWQVCQQALLPKIEHGSLEGSVAIPGEAFFRSKVTAEQDIIAQKNIIVTGDITVDNQINTKTLVATDTITATKNIGTRVNLEVRKAHIEDLAADDLYVEELVAEKATVTKELNVQKEKPEDADAVATIDKADIAAAEIDEVTVTANGKATFEAGSITTFKDGSKIIVNNDNTDDAIITNATVTNTLKVAKASSEDADAQIIADMATMTNAEVINNIKTKDLESTGTILANNIGTTNKKVTKMVAAEAAIDKISSDNITNSNTVATATANVSSVLNVTNQAKNAKANIDNATIGYADIADTDISYAEIVDTDIGTATITKADKIDYAYIVETAIDSAEIKAAKVTDTLTVTNTDPEKAKIDNATINNTINVLTTANVHNTANNAILNADHAVISGTFTATTALANNAANMTVNKAKFTELIGDDINQKVNGQYYDVPVMFLDKVGSEYQLKISRVNKTF